MTSASSSSARSLFADSKQRLAERVQANLNNIASLTRQVQRGSKSAELLMRSAREFASCDHVIENSEANLNKMNLIAVHMTYQYENMQKSADKIDEIKEQVISNLKRTLFNNVRLQQCKDEMHDPDESKSVSKSNKNQFDVD